MQRRLIPMLQTKHDKALGSKPLANSREECRRLRQGVREQYRGEGDAGGSYWGALVDVLLCLEEVLEEELGHEVEEELCEGLAEFGVVYMNPWSILVFLRIVHIRRIVYD